MNLQRFYLPLNLAFVLLIFVGSTVGGAASPRMLHLILLFALCSAPLLSVRRVNDRFMLLVAFMAMYFIFFGAIDLEILLGVTDSVNPGSGLIDTTEVLALLGGAAFLLGYYLSAGFSGASTQTKELFTNDWPPNTVVVVGFILLIAGGVSDLVLQLVVAPDKTGASIGRGLNMLGPYLSALVILGNYVRSLGIVCLAYSYAKRRSVTGLVLILIMLVSQVILALLIDVKATALIGGVIVVATLLLVRGQFPWRWAIAAAVASSLLFPVLQAYRHAIGEGNTTRYEAAANFGKYVAEAFKTRTQVSSGRSRERAESILERENMKPSVDLIVQHTGLDVQWQNGATLAPLLTVFIPRFLMPDKAGSAVGILFNTEFRIGAGEDTYISPSHLGELYWNFGWAGAIGGMLAIGMMFGWVGRVFDLSKRATLTRLLVLLTTLSVLGLGFEGSVATPYAVWVRTVGFIMLLHVIFARVKTLTTDANTVRTAEEIGSAPLFPNLMR